MCGGHVCLCIYHLHWAWISMKGCSIGTQILKRVHLFLRYIAFLLLWLFSSIVCPESSRSLISLRLWQCCNIYVDSLCPPKASKLTLMIKVKTVNLCAPNKLRRMQKLWKSHIYLGFVATCLHGTCLQDLGHLLGGAHCKLWKISDPE